MESDFNVFKPNLAPYNKSNHDLNTMIPAIDGLYLGRIIAKSMDADSGYGWDRQTAEEIAEMYRVFLFLCKTYPEKNIVPPREVDEFWHLHILDTQNYAKDCNAIFGCYLHHFPYAGLEGTALSEDKEQALMQETLELVKKHFPELLDEGDGLL